MLKIRLQRVGRKHEPVFRIVLTNSLNSTKSGRFLEILGSYDARRPLENVDALRVKHWMSKGAQLTGTLHNLFVSKKIIEGKKINVLPKRTPIVKEVKEEAKKAEVAEVAETSPAKEETAPEAPAESVPVEAPKEEVAVSVEK
ncbi:MAG: 30S ribosomal protein S16 [Patescibacteria group bacterium]